MGAERDLNDLHRSGELSQDLFEQSVPSGPDGRPWTPPVPLVAASRPSELQAGTLPDWLESFVVAVSRATGAPIDLCRLLAIGVLSMTLAQVFRVQLKRGWEVPVNLYLVFAAAPSTKKSPAYNAFLEPVRAHEQTLRESWSVEVARRAELRASLEERLKKVRRTKKTPADSTILSAETDELVRALEAHPELSVPRLLGDDATPEALVKLMETNGGRLAITSDEGGVFDMMAGRYQKDANLDIYLKAWEGTPVTVDRVNREGSHVEEPTLTLLLAVQPGVLEQLGSAPVLTSRGLLQRFLYGIRDGHPPPHPFDAPPVPQEVEDEYERRLGGLLRLHPSAPGRSAPDARVLSLSGEARALFADFHDELERRKLSDLSELAEWVGKRAGDTAKLAGLLEVAGADEPLQVTEIRVGAMVAAISIMRGLIGHARYALGLVGLTPEVRNAKYVLGRLLAKASVASFSEKEVLDWCSGACRKAAFVREVLKLLGEHDFIRVVPVRPPGPKGGRPRSQEWMLNPLARQ